MQQRPATDKPTLTLSYHFNHTMHIVCLAVVAAAAAAVVAAQVDPRSLTDIDLSALPSSNVTTWSCNLLSSVTIAPGAVWQRMNCSSKDIPFWGPMGPLVVNVVTADLSTPTLKLVPVAAKENNGRWDGECDCA